MNAAVGRGELASAITSTAEGIALMVETRPDMDRRLPKSEWTVGEATAHVAVAQGIFAGIAAGGGHPYAEPTVERFAAMNRQGIEQVGDRTGRGVAAMIRARTKSLLADLSTAADQQTFEAPIGRLTTVQLMSYCLSHLLMHGYPIALAVGARCPLEPSHVRLVVPFIEAATPFSSSNLSGRALEARIDFRVGDGTRFGLILSRGSARIVNPPPDRVDVHIYARPVPFLLVTLGLASPWSMLAHGGGIVWGRRPWLALQLKEALPNL